MVFQSIDYLLFLAAVFAAYWMLPRRGQNLFLLGASYFFYGYIHPWYCLLIATTTLVDWFCARRIGSGAGGRKRWLATSLTVNFSILATFKYFNFFTDNVIAAAGVMGFDLDQPHWRVLLPVGISFYTFQSASYVVDVFRGRERARHRLDDYALFVSFFPQLVAGPIERAGNLLARIEAPRLFRSEAVRSGVLLLLWGLLLKRGVADNVAVVANKVFALQEPSFPILWAGVFAFGVQIFADFSAYTCMARGSARLLGFELQRNFNHPWLSISPVDFWRRWHISLSTWFRDYIYIPLGGGRGTAGRVTRNVLVTFALSGLWHGANWNFVLWGVWHGLLVAAWHLLAARWPSLDSASGWRKAVMWLATGAAVHVGWLFFREQDLAMIGRALTLAPWAASWYAWEVAFFLFLQCVLFAAPVWIWPLLEKVHPRLRLPLAGNGWARNACDGVAAAVLVVMILLFASPVGSDFIYFQF